MASAVLGVAFRMATALGLHKEPLEGNKTQDDLENHLTSAETRWCTWWSLFCLDTGASMTLGRPTFGRWDPYTMNVSLPRYGKSQSCPDMIINLFRANVDFYPPTIGEIKTFDTALRSWYEKALAAISPENYSDDFIVVRDYMRNRYMNVRILLWPVLLRHVENKASFEDLAYDDREAIVNCQNTWYLYQSCLVPLMVLLAFPCQPELPSCHSEIEQALAAFKSFIPWNAAARRLYDVVESIYEASKDVTGPGESREILTAFGGMDMEFWDLAPGGFEYDYEWESLIDWEKARTPNVED